MIARLALALSFAALAAGALAGCAGDEGALSPRDSFKEDDAGPGTGPSDAGPTEPDAAPPKRTVIHRNPFGDVVRTENLLWDGDFEFSSPLSDEYGWILGPPFSFSFGSVKIGPECRSGLKCAALPKKKYLIAIGVGSMGSKLEAIAWVRPATPTCDGLEVALTSLSNDEADVEVPAAGPPDETGWCRFSVVADARKAKTYLAVHNQSEGDVIVDDASLERVPATKALTVAIGAPTAAEVASLAVVRDAIAKLRGPHDTPPNAALRAFREGKR